MYNYILPFIIYILFFTGCSNYVEYLSPNTKKHIYKDVQNEILTQTDKGDISYKTGYLADAISAYEIVNFYENKPVIPLKKINKIKSEAKNNASYHYNLALKHSKTDKKRALLEFNNVLKNIHNYKDTKTQINILKQDEKMKKFIYKLEVSLHKELISNTQTTSQLRKIHFAYHKLKKYDLQNSLLKSAQHQIKIQYSKLINEAITLYNKGSLLSANKKFTTIKSIYKYDKIADNYLLMIKNTQEKEALIKKAKEALQEKKYLKAQKYAQEVLLKDSQNKVAIEIMKNADKGSKEELSTLLDKGKENYNNKNLNKALENFQEVLVRYPDNTTALIYVKKIKMQLQTIKSLE